mgnify:CR=1 FL=1
MKLSIGNKASLEKIFSENEVKLFGKISNDTNPIHIDKDYASQTIFKKPIVHGMLAASLFGGLLGSKLPGKGTIYLNQNIKFLKPNFVGEKVIVTIEIIKIIKEKSIYIFSTKCFNSSNDLTIEGEATIMYKGEFFK